MADKFNFEDEDLVTSTVVTPEILLDGGPGSTQTLGVGEFVLETFEGPTTP